MSAENSLQLPWYASLSAAERQARFAAWQTRKRDDDDRVTNRMVEEKLFSARRLRQPGQGWTISRNYWQMGIRSGEINLLASAEFIIRDGVSALFIYKEGESGRFSQYVDLDLYFSGSLRLRDVSHWSQYDAYVGTSLNGLALDVFYLANRISRFAVNKGKRIDKDRVSLLDSTDGIGMVLKTGQIPAGILKAEYEAVTDSESGLVSIQKRGTDKRECLLEFPTHIKSKEEIAEALVPKERFVDPFETDPMEDRHWMEVDLLGQFGVKFYGLNNHQEN